MAPKVDALHIRFAQKLCELTYKTKRPGQNYIEFKKENGRFCDNMFRELGLHAVYSPHIEYDEEGEYIRLVLANISKVVFVCVPGSRSIQDHVANLEVSPHRLFRQECEEDEAYAPAGYVEGMKTLRIVPFVRKLLENSSIEKVILCGHSRGGSIAHVAHYYLLTNPTFKIKEKHKLLSLAFGSTPFLMCKQPKMEYKDYFVTFVTEKDLVPALFAPAILERVKGILVNDSRALIFAVLVWYIFNIDTAKIVTERIEVNRDVFSKYQYYGTWKKLSNGRIDEVDPLHFFSSGSFTSFIDEISTLDDIKEFHSIVVAYSTSRLVSASPTIDQTEASHVYDVMLTAAVGNILSKSVAQENLVNVLTKSIVVGEEGACHGDLAVIQRLKDLLDAIDRYHNITKQVLNTDDASNWAHEEEFQRMKTSWSNLLNSMASCSTFQTVEDQPTNMMSIESTSIYHLALFIPQVLSINYCFAHSITKKNVVYYGLAIAGSLIAIYFGLWTIELTHYGYTFWSTLTMSDVAEVFAGSIATSVLTYLSGKGSAAARARAHQNFKNNRYAFVDWSYYIRKETCMEVSSMYESQLQEMLRVGNIKPISSKLKDAVNLERLLSTGRPQNFSHPQQERIFCAYTNVVKKIVKLREEMANVILIMLHGEQGVGKSSFIRAVQERGIPSLLRTREPTTAPKFFQYTPVNKNIEGTHVYLIDLPGDDTLNHSIIEKVTTLYGIGTIGIYLYKFDVSPANLRLDTMLRTISGYQSVLAALNKVTSVNFDQPLEEILNRWKEFFYTSGANEEAKLTLMATDMTGKQAIFPIVEMQKYHQALVTYELEQLRSKGGKTTQDVIEWIDSAIQLNMTAEV